MDTVIQSRAVALDSAKERGRLPVVRSGDGDGYGDGYGFGNGNGFGDGDGFGDGNGNGGGRLGDCPWIL